MFPFIDVFLIVDFFIVTFNVLNIIGLYASQIEEHHQYITGSKWNHPESSQTFSASRRTVIESSSQPLSCPPSEALSNGSRTPPRSLLFTNSSWAFGTLGDYDEDKGDNHYEINKTDGDGDGDGDILRSSIGLSSSSL